MPPARRGLVDDPGVAQRAESVVGDLRVETLVELAAGGDTDGDALCVTPERADPLKCLLMLGEVGQLGRGDAGADVSVCDLPGGVDQRALMRPASNHGDLEDEAAQGPDIDPATPQVDVQQSVRIC